MRHGTSGRLRAGHGRPLQLTASVACLELAPSGHTRGVQTISFGPPFHTRVDGCGRIIPRPPEPRFPGISPTAFDPSAQLQCYTEVSHGVETAQPGTWRNMESCVTGAPMFGFRVGGDIAPQACQSYLQDARIPHVDLRRSLPKFMLEAGTLLRFETTGGSSRLNLDHV